MEKTCKFIFASLVLLLTSQKPCTAKTFTNLATDLSSLLSLKAQIVVDPSHTITKNWTNSSSVCSWIGVTCGTRHQRVATLNISNMGLSGTIPPQLGNLSFLVSLDLRRNNFSGTLPHELSLLRRLRFLSLLINNFRGEIPSWLSFLPKLDYLSLRNNSFTGSIPKSISNLTNLYYLDFSYNSLEGIIPQELGRLQKLQHLALNQLSGQIPSNLSRCSQLGLLSLASNSFSGQILLNLDEEHGDKIVEFSSSILELACKCSAKSPNDRINMKEALPELLPNDLELIFCFS